jgi:replicative DNA helicase
MIPLLKLLLYNNIFNKYHNYIYNLIKDNKDLSFIYNCITKLQTTYNKDISYEELSLYVITHCLDKDKDKYKLLLDSIKETTNDSTIIDTLLVELLNKHTAYELAILATEVSEGLKSFDDLLLLTQKINSTTSFVDTFTEDCFTTNDLNELYNSSISQSGLRWRLNSLNKSLGSLRQGDFGFIFARPETGKTTFLASEISFFSSQSSKPILWFNNEEQGNKVQLRCYQALHGIELIKLFSKRDYYQQEYITKGGNNVRIYDSANITKRVVEDYAKKYNPACIVFDQLDKIQGFSADREDLRLGNIYIWARELAKKYCPVIGVCQADASAEGKRWLTMDNVANAKTAKQAEADWILGIGKSHNESEEYQRFLSICKNKLFGDEDTDPSLRHGKLTVNILPEIARYGD